MNKIIIKLGFLILIGIFAFIGLGFLIAALFLFINSYLKNPTLTALIIGLISLFIACIFMLIYVIVKKQIKKHQPKQNIFLGIVKDVLQQHPGGSTFLALSTGFLVASSSFIRRQLLDLITTSLKLATYSKTSRNKLGELLISFLQENFFTSREKSKDSKDSQER